LKAPVTRMRSDMQFTAEQLNVNKDSMQN